MSIETIMRPVILCFLHNIAKGPAQLPHILQSTVDSAIDYCCASLHIRNLLAAFCSKT